MAAADRPTKPTGYTDKQTVRVLTVDKGRSRVECATRDGASIYAAIWETPISFRWPKTGEIWTVRKDTGIWRMGELLRTPVEEELSGDWKLDELKEGETRILGDRVYVREIVTKVPVGGIEEVASANTLVLNSIAILVKVTGTTEIKKINGTVAGHRVVLRFGGSLVVKDGENLKLSGNFEATADDTLDLIYDGSNWYEIGRSVN